ncbi:MAG: bifunctional (p)ppGpp synthetase/guanosine-3',5'-bis(diphosphate) 3'-pyrophosphohydrolase [Erysipelotrichaceae bacterium]|nr:bifunctional (p)ppGpp synthetase/guanosine-3',5'-bis(diphosphate) 3'-pyrophosphohydrolase [Erysipelotrichaceae bacterium]
MENNEINNEVSITSFNTVLSVINTYIKNDEDKDFITRAFNYAKEKHEGQVRKSGEPYINHLLSVTYILALYQQASDTLAAGLLHDTLEDCGVSYQDLKSTFNQDVADIVQAVTKIKNLPDVSLEETSASTHRKLILAMAKDIRAVIVKLCDRLHNMRTLKYLRYEKQMLIAKETLDVYAPLAHRLGMSALKNELENLCLYYLHPTEYNIVQSLISEKLSIHKFNIKDVIDSISVVLDKNNIPHRIFGRTKHTYSVYKKMYVKHTPFEKIFDLQAIRIVTLTKLQCYEILGIIHTIYKPIPGRFKDYIAMPKTNMYQSLHTTVMDKNGELFEIQIRTEEMDYIAERGIAAHWIYKENNGNNLSKAQELSEQQLSWLRDLIKINEENADESDVEYMKQIQKDIFETSIYVLTPKGKIIDMPNGSTPVDFAYRVHTIVGNTCVGALVNRVIVPLNTELQSGDIVEIKTSKNSVGPSEGWLDFVKTNIAKSQIKKALLKRQQSNIQNGEKIEELKYEKGIKMFNDACKERFINVDEAMKQLDFLSNLNLFNVSSKRDFFIAIGNKSISLVSVFSKLYEQNKSVVEQLGVLKRKDFVVKQEKYKGNIFIKGAGNGIKIEPAVCCKPLPGDKIVGFISRGKGIKIHRIDCPNIINEKKRLIEAFWNENNLSSSYPVDIEILSYDRNNLVIDLMGLISEMNIRIDSMSARSHYENKTATLSCTVYISSIEMLNTVFAKIKSINGVIEVKRISH